MVFVGYGINAPEYGWNDYKFGKVQGKILIMFVNEPHDKDNQKYFKGDRLTYYGIFRTCRFVSFRFVSSFADIFSHFPYLLSFFMWSPKGRWMYKYEEARRQGAKGVILIHTNPTASYPFSVLANQAEQVPIFLFFIVMIKISLAETAKKKLT